MIDGPCARRAGRAGAAALLAALAVCAALGRPATVHFNRYSAEDGQRLLHGDAARPLSGWALPGAALAAAAGEVPGPEGRARLARAALFCAALAAGALGAALGRGAGPGAAAALVAALYLARAPADGPLDFELVLYGAALALAGAGLCAPLKLRARASAAGLALGMGLLLRSPMLLFPPLLLAWEARGRWGRSRRLRAAAPALLLPLALLGPGLALTPRSGSASRLLDGARAESNLIAGALGLVETMEGDARALAGLRPEQSALRWAAAEILGRPLHYALAAARRILWALGLHPLLAAAAAAALWRFRREERFRLAALLGAYYLVGHALCAIEARYLIPFWLLCAALAGSHAAGLGPRLPRAGAAAAAAAALPLALASAWTLALSARWLLRRGRPYSYEQEAARRPEDAWLLKRAGRARLERGEIEAARADFARALALRPEPERALDLSLALFALGRLDQQRAFLESAQAGHPGALLLALDALRAGRAEEARLGFARAEGLWRASSSYLRGARARDRRLAERLARVDRGLARELVELLDRLPYGLRVELRRALARPGILPPGLDLPGRAA